MGQRMIRLSKSRQTLSLSAIILLLLAAPLFFQSCTNYIAYYDPIALDKSVSLKMESLNLMEKAAEPYADHEKEIKDLMLKVEQAYEYTSSLPKNRVTARQWEIMKDPGRNLLGGFFKYWEKEGKLSPVFIEESTGVISRAFDTIIRLETRKDR